MRQPTHHWMEQKARYDWGYEKAFEQPETVVQTITGRNGYWPGRPHSTPRGDRLKTCRLDA